MQLRVVEDIGVVQAYVADASEAKDRTKAIGWLSAVTSLGAVAGPALGSLLANLGGRHAPGVASAILCLLVSVFAARFLPRITRAAKVSLILRLEGHQGKLAGQAAAG